MLLEDLCGPRPDVAEALQHNLNLFACMTLVHCREPFHIGLSSI